MATTLSSPVAAFDLGSEAFATGASVHLDACLDIADVERIFAFHSVERAASRLDINSHALKRGIKPRCFLDAWPIFHRRPF